MYAWSEISYSIINPLSRMLILKRELDPSAPFCSCVGGGVGEEADEVSLSYLLQKSGRDGRRFSSRMKHSGQSDQKKLSME